MFASGSINSGGMTIVDRGDPSSPDFTVGNFTLDAAWHDLDLSAIVPAGAMGVLISVVTDTSDANQQIMFRKKGNANYRNVAWIYNHNYCEIQGLNCIIFGDTDRKIQYMSNTQWTKLDFTVCGWFLP